MGATKANRVSGMAFIHEKIEEARHNETLAYLMFMAGAIFFIGGLLETVITTENPDWFLFFPYKITPHAYSFLGLFMVLSGFMLLVSGIVLCVQYASDRTFYFGQLKEVNVTKKNKKLKIRAGDQGTKTFVKQLARANRELGECKSYLMNHMGLYENDSMYYCKVLGSRWRELIKEEELHTLK